MNFPAVVPCNSCGAEIFWCTTKSGKRIPMNLQGHGVPKGSFAIYSSGDTTVAVYVKAVYQSHFSTCLQGKEWRKDG